MSTVLKHTVVAGGVLYAAGTSATPELRGIIRAKHWSDGDQDVPYIDVPGSAPTAAALAATSDPETNYNAFKVDELKSHIEVRNQGRAEADLISTEGKKADLVAALQADDQRGSQA